MPVYRLARSGTSFPSPHDAEPDGLLAIGGDLSVPRIVAAYSAGIFPWYSAGNPILWWSPDPRCILLPEEFHMPRSLRRTLQKNEFSLTCNCAFEAVITACATARTPNASHEDEGGTWLVPDMIKAYVALHQAGIAHSVEAWHNGELAGGLYGVALGRAFFGESMFYKKPNASKAALAHLVSLALRKGVTLIDCQQQTDNLVRFGARPVSRTEFLERLGAALTAFALPELWADRA